MRFLDRETEPQRRYNVPPSALLPLVYESAAGAQRRHGDVRTQAVLVEEMNPSPSNARLDSLRDNKNMFRSAFPKQVGFIPVDYFVEWQQRDDQPKRPWIIQRADHQPMLMAALWEPAYDGGAPTTTIATTDANEWMQPVHDRMPLILEPHELKQWMDPHATRDELLAMIQPGADGVLERYPVSPMINRPIEDPRVIEPITMG